MRQTSKLISIDNNGAVLVYSSKGMLSEFINVPRETIVNWFRLSNYYVYNGVKYYKASQYITRDKRQ